MAETTDWRRYLLISVAVACGSFAVCLVAAEIFTRVFLGHYIDTESLRADLDRAWLKTLIEPHDDPELSFALKANLDTAFHESRVVTDSDRVRIPTNPEPALDGGLRIAIVGDSTAFGWRVNYEDSYAERVRTAIARTSDVPPTLRNFSVPGYNASQAYRVFSTKVVSYRPDLLIVHHDPNDTQPTGWGYPRGYFPPEYGDNFLRSALLKFTIRQARVARNRIDEFTGNDPHEYVDGYCVSGPLYDEHLRSRRALVEHATDLGIPVVTVLFNADVKLDEDYESSDRFIRLHRQLAERLQEMGFHVVDLFPHYQRLLRERGWEDMLPLMVDEDDYHPSVEGQAFIGDVLYRYLREHPELITRQR